MASYMYKENSTYLSAICQFSGTLKVVKNNFFFHPFPHPLTYTIYTGTIYISTIYTSTIYTCLGDSLSKLFNNR